MSKESRAMPGLQELREEIQTRGRIDTPELEALRREVYRNGRIDRAAADVLVELHKRVRNHNPGWEDFFYRAITDHLLADGQIDHEETAWVRQMLYHDGRIDDRERKFLHELKGEARQVSRAFEELFAESMKQPQEQHTSGHG
jgi:hypothetical protein